MHVVCTDHIIHYIRNMLKIEIREKGGGDVAEKIAMNSAVIKKL